MAICLPKFAADAIREKFTSGQFNPERLAAMTSAERRAAFTEVVGEANARLVNAGFESKLLLKNQQQGLVTWAQQLLGQRQAALRDTVSKIERLGDVMTPKELDLFLEDLVSQKLGVEITAKEAATLAELVKDVNEAKVKIPEGAPPRHPARLEYGTARALFSESVEALMIGNRPKFLERVLKDKRRLAKEALGATKSSTASLDASFIGIQGIKALTTHPVLAVQAIGAALKAGKAGFLGKDGIIPIKADIWSRPGALDGTYVKGRLAAGLAKEEAFPSSLPTKIPVIGRLFKFSDNAFQGFALRLRADLMDFYVNRAKMQGIDITDPVQLRGIGELANSMSGRSGLGRWEAVGDTVNVVLFSPRFWTSNLQFLTAHLLDPKSTPFVKKQAAQNLLKTVATVGSVLAMADALGFEIDLDTNSTNFGKIKIEDTWVDITGKLASVVVLASRMFSGKMKTMTGKTYDLKSDAYGALNRLDVLYSFAEGKSSPALGATLDILKGEDFDGNEPTLISTALNLTQPFSTRDITKNLESADSADQLLTYILLGLNAAGFTTSSPR